MARKYIHELAGWPAFTWDAKTLAPLLSGVRLHQGLLLGKMRGYGLTLEVDCNAKRPYGRNDQIERHRRGCA